LEHHPTCKSTAKLPISIAYSYISQRYPNQGRREQDKPQKPQNPQQQHQQHQHHQQHQQHQLAEKNKNKIKIKK
jgi:hypothetical protein